MLRIWPALALALFHPDPVEDIDAVLHADGSLTISWTLPADSSVTGLTIFRDNLDEGDTTIFEIVGVTSSYTDTTADPDDDYRYWVHTRDAQGDLSEGVYVEVFGDGDDGHGFWTCSSSIAPPGSPWTFLLAAGALLVAFRRGR